MIDEYIAEINRRLVATARQRTRIIEDIRDHLTDAIEQLVAEGVDERSAEQRAISAFGSATDLARQFNVHAAAIAMRRAPLMMAACGIAVVAGFVFAAITQPAPPSPKPAGVVQQVAFFAAALGLEFAFVAGLRVVARASARWRTTPRPTDQLLLRRAAIVFVAGLAVAAAGWTVVLAEVLAGSSNRRAIPLAVGIVVMVGATIVASVVTARQRTQVTGAEPLAPPEPDVADHMVFGAAERAVRWINHHPRSTCAAAAILTGLAAMSHAETTALGALPWGATQAAAVIAGFVLVGPTLELREAKSAHRAAD